MEDVRNFIKNEEAVETIEFLVILAVVAGLFAVIVSVGKTIKAKGTAVAGKLDDYARSGG